MIIQAINRTVEDSFDIIEFSIRPPQHKIPIIGKYGQNGNLKGLGLWGSVFLKIKTAKHTMQTTIFTIA